MCYNMPVAKKDGLVAQLVRALACHARGRGFEPHPGRHFFTTNLCGFSSFGRASPCQGEGGGFEPRNPLQKTKAHGCGHVFFVFFRRSRGIRTRSREARRVRDFFFGASRKRNLVVWRDSDKPVEPRRRIE